jgi:hypothetical protein
LGSGFCAFNRFAANVETEAVNTPRNDRRRISNASSMGEVFIGKL